MTPDVCVHHDQRNKDIEQIHRAVSKHSGQWKVLLVVLAIFGGSLFYMNQRTQNAVANIETSTRRIELTFSNYMSAHKVEAANGFARISQSEEVINDNKRRIRALESR